MTPWQWWPLNLLSAARMRDVVAASGHVEDEPERAGFFSSPEKTAIMIQNLRTFRGALKALAIGRGKARIQRDD